MYWLHLLIVAPVWGMISGQLFLQCVLSVINFIIAAVGLLKRKVPLDMIAAALVASFFSAVPFAALLIFGIFLMSNYTSFGKGVGQPLIFWLFFVFSLWFMAEQFISKITKHWRDLARAGSLQLVIFETE